MSSLRGGCRWVPIQDCDVFLMFFLQLFFVSLFLCFFVFVYRRALSTRFRVIRVVCGQNHKSNQFPPSSCSHFLKMGSLKISVSYEAFNWRVGFDSSREGS